MTSSDGDLWPSAWGSDDCLYAAAGDGTRVRAARLERHPRQPDRRDPETGLTGERLADGDAVAPIWDPERFNRKPTGMVCVPIDGHDVLFLAVQDLRCTPGPDMFNEAPDRDDRAQRRPRAELVAGPTSRCSPTMSSRP